jgi:hypothetical protein
MSGRIRRRRSVIAVACIVAATAAAVSPSTVPVGAAPTAGTDGACPGASGVTVIVDFRGLAGGTVVRCAPGAPASGLDALREAGFDVRGVARFPGFVCRIDGAPASSTCLDTPPPDAYWSYWTAPRGGSWTYSDTGAASRTPTPGSVEGWSFSDGRDAAPRLAPPAAVTPAANAPATPAPPVAPAPIAAAPAAPAADPDANPVPTPSAPAGPVAAGAAGAAPTVTPPPEVAGVTTSVAPATPDAPGRPPTAGPDDGSDSNATDRAATNELATAATGADDTSSTASSPIGTVLGLGLVAALGAVAVVVVRRRRPTDA